MDSVSVNPRQGQASLRFTDLPVDDWISVPNSLSLGTKIAGTPLPATMSLDIEWSGVSKRLGHFRDETLGFVDDLVEVETVTVAASTQQNSAAPGSSQAFSFMSDPASFVSSFSVVGTEQNGSFAKSLNG